VIGNQKKSTGLASNPLPPQNNLYLVCQARRKKGGVSQKNLSCCSRGDLIRPPCRNCRLQTTHLRKVGGGLRLHAKGMSKEEGEGPGYQFALCKKQGAPASSCRTFRQSRKNGESQHNKERSYNQEGRGDHGSRKRKRCWAGTQGDIVEPD